MARLGMVNEEITERHQAAHEGPCGLFEEAVGPADANHGAGTAELRREAAAFRFLNEDDADEEHRNDNCQDNDDIIHSSTIFSLASPEGFWHSMAPVYYQFLQKSQLVCKVSTFFWKFQT